MDPCLKIFLFCAQLARKICLIYKQWIEEASCLSVIKSLRLQYNPDENICVSVCSGWESRVRQEKGVLLAKSLVAPSTNFARVVKVTEGQHCLKLGYKCPSAWNFNGNFTPNYRLIHILLSWKFTILTGFLTFLELRVATVSNSLPMHNMHGNKALSSYVGMTTLPISFFRITSPTCRSEVTSTTETQWLAAPSFEIRNSLGRVRNVRSNTASNSEASQRPNGQSGEKVWRKLVDLLQVFFYQINLSQAFLQNKSPPGF